MYWPKRVLSIVLLAVMLATSHPLFNPTPVAAAPPTGAARPQSAAAQRPIQQDAPQAVDANEALIFSYAAKFVCTESLQPGQFFFGAAAPVVQQKTDVLVHNPSGYPVQFYKKAVLSPLERFNEVQQGVAPGAWRRVALQPDYSFRIDCDDIAKLLTGKDDATFIGTYGIGVTVEGFVVIGIGMQNIAGTNIKRQGILDVTAEYVRASEFMKKDINYQPWWSWWWWGLPWRLAYPYQRIIPIQPDANIDCRGMLYDALANDVQTSNMVKIQQDATIQALEAGRSMDPATPHTITDETPAALVAMIGRCDKISTTAMTVDYLLVSNKANSDANPLDGVTPVQISVRYPWTPGRWYDLALVTPQNLDVDIDHYFRTWQTQRWITAGGAAADIEKVMPYWFPYWCGWGYWYWWWNGGDCIDIGVGNGESLDVEQVTPTRVFMGQWPPIP